MSLLRLDCQRYGTLSGYHGGLRGQNVECGAQQGGNRRLQNQLRATGRRCYRHGELFSFQATTALPGGRERESPRTHRFIYSYVHEHYIAVHQHTRLLDQISYGSIPTLTRGMLSAAVARERNRRHRHPAQARRPEGVWRHGFEGDALARLQLASSPFFEPGYPAELTGHTWLNYPAHSALSFSLIT